MSASVAGRYQPTKLEIAFNALAAGIVYGKLGWIAQKRVNFVELRHHRIDSFCPAKASSLVALVKLSFRGGATNV